MSGLLGGWKLADFQAGSLPEKAASAFAAVKDSLVGASYVPVLYCGSQVVRGTNYMILCEQRLSDQEGTRHLVKMVINAFQEQYDIVYIDTII